MTSPTSIRPSPPYGRSPRRASLPPRDGGNFIRYARRRANLSVSTDGRAPQWQGSAFGCSKRAPIPIEHGSRNQSRHAETFSLMSTLRCASAQFVRLLALNPSGDESCVGRITNSNQRYLLKSEKRGCRRALCKSSEVCNLVLSDHGENDGFFFAQTVSISAQRG